MLDTLKTKAIKKELVVLYLTYRHPNVPWYTKLLTVIVIGYAISPIDLIPDFVPILGYLDDLILIPAGIALVLRMLPKEVLAECRIQAAEMEKISIGKGWAAAVIIVLLWASLVWVLLSKFI